MTRLKYFSAGLVLLGVCVLHSTPADATDPMVNNVAWAQRSDGSGLVDITYEVNDEDGDLLSIAVAVSSDNGSTWNFPCYSLSGDIGHGISPGSGKAVTWDLAHDAPDFTGSDFRIRVIASDSGVMHTTHSPGKYWIMQWRAVDWSNPTNVEKFAKGDVLVINAWDLWGNTTNENLRVVERLKAVNPALKIFLYALPQTTLLTWETQTTAPLCFELFHRTKPYWSYTTTGDTLFNWPQQVVLNILDPDCRRAVVDTYVEFAQASNNQVDGIFWDYFANNIWISPAAAESVVGEPDLDGDGVVHAVDSQEIAAFKAASDSLVLYMRELMGEDFLQIFNGPRAHTDSSFAALGDGMYYEIYPNEVFPDPDVAKSLDPSYAYNLFRTSTWPRQNQGGPFIVLGCIWRNFYTDYLGQPSQLSNGDVYRVVALFTDIYSAWLDAGSHTYSWPDVEINLGQPLGPTVIEGANYSREFEHGTVEMVMESGAYPNPFRYVIKCNGVVVEELNIPYHFP